MTQAHKTYKAIVVLKDYIPDIKVMRFVVIGEIFPGHLHLISLDVDGVELKGFHDDRFKTYHGPDLKKLKVLAKKFIA